MDFSLDHVAKLAKLQLTPEEKELFARQFPAILEYVDRLRTVDTAHIDARAYLTDAVNVWREDVPAAKLDERNAVVDSFPKKAGDALEVPGIFS